MPIEITEKEKEIVATAIRTYSNLDIIKVVNINDLTEQERRELTNTASEISYIVDSELNAVVGYVKPEVIRGD